MRVSFIIPAHDEERLIGPTIRALVGAACALRLDSEIIVACDGCTDATAQIAERAGARAITIDRRHIAATRNAGAAAATGDLLIFVDADTLVPPDAVALAIQAVRRGAVGGGATFEFDGPIPLYARLMMSLMNIIARTAGLTGGCFLFCTRHAFHRAGGWDESLFVSEEIALARALKRLGRFKIVPARVRTSGRKLRTHSGREVFALLLRAAMSPSMVRDRSRLDLWYGPRREDPHRRAPNSV